MITTMHCFCCCWGNFYRIIPETITIMKTPHTCHFFTVGDVPVQNSGLVTWIIHHCATVFWSVLFSGATVVFVQEAKATCVASSSCPIIVPHWQFCKLLTVAIINHPTWKKVLQSFKVGFWHSHVIMSLRSSHHRPEVNNQPRAGLDWVAGFLWSKPSTKLPPLSTSGSESYTDPRWSVKTLFCLLNYFYELATF